MPDKDIVDAKVLASPALSPTNVLLPMVLFWPAISPMKVFSVPLMLSWPAEKRIVIGSILHAGALAEKGV